MGTATASNVLIDFLGWNSIIEFFVTASKLTFAVSSRKSSLEYKITRIGGNIHHRQFNILRNSCKRVYSSHWCTSSYIGHYDVLWYHIHGDKQHGEREILIHCEMGFLDVH